MTLSIYLFVQAAQSAAGSSMTASTFWELVGYARGFEYPIGLVFLVGLFLICSSYVRALNQWKSHKTLSRLDPSAISRSALGDALNETPAINPYRRACEKLLEGDRHQNKLTYVLQYIDLDQERYREVDRYINAAVYVVLSLGLLGTLLGIFVLFTSSERHEASDLVGLGIAVVSTLLALVVRLILWPANLIVQAWVRRRFLHLKEWCAMLAIAEASGSLDVQETD